MLFIQKNLSKRHEIQQNGELKKKKTFTFLFNQINVTSTAITGRLSCHYFEK